MQRRAGRSFVLKSRAGLLKRLLGYLIVKRSLEIAGIDRCKADLGVAPSAPKLPAEFPDFGIES
jgi:hypothetical protein